MKTRTRNNCPFSETGNFHLRNQNIKQTKINKFSSALHRPFGETTPQELSSASSRSLLPTTGQALGTSVVSVMHVCLHGASSCPVRSHLAGNEGATPTQHLPPTSTFAAATAPHLSGSAGRVQLATTRGDTQRGLGRIELARGFSSLMFISCRSYPVMSGHVRSCPVLHESQR